MKCWNCGSKHAEMTYTDYWVDYDRVSDERMSLEMKNFKEKHSGLGSVRPRYFCKECFDNRNKSLRETRTEYAKLKKRLMLERAVRMFEKQTNDIYDYKDIIDDMTEYVEENPDKFDSSHEMLAAIVLVDNAIKAKMQYKIDKYRVDFYLPDYKIVLEIDGDLHKNNLYRDNQRDIKIREILGNDWEIVRISTKYIEQNASALVDAMIAVKKEKQKLRKQHHGYLPEWYSARNKAQRTRSMKVGDDHLFDVD